MAAGSPSNYFMSYCLHHVDVPSHGSLSLSPIVCGVLFRKDNVLVDNRGEEVMGTW